MPRGLTLVADKLSCQLRLRWLPWARMHAFARILQLFGLAIPPLAIIAQLANRITAGQMLRFLVASICIFLAGYLMQQYRGQQR